MAGVEPARRPGGAISFYIRLVDRKGSPGFPFPIEGAVFYKKIRRV